MKKIVITILLGTFSLGFFLKPGYAQLNKDIQYIRGYVVSVDMAHHTLAIKEGNSPTSPVKTFDITGARLNGNLAKGQDVFVIVPVKSNKAKSVRIIPPAKPGKK